MPRGVDKNIVKEHYARMTDQELIWATTQNADNLTPEALEVIHEVLKARNLDNQVSGAIEAQNKEYTTEEIDQYCIIVQNLPCTFCNRTDNKLNGSMVGEVRSYVIVTDYDKKPIIGCPECLDKIASKATSDTLWLGWWGIPWGPIRTLEALALNEESKKLHHSESPNKYLRSFTLSKIGEVEMYKNDKVKLAEIISIFR